MFNVEISILGLAFLCLNPYGYGCEENSVYLVSTECELSDRIPCRIQICDQNPNVVWHSPKLLMPWEAIVTWTNYAFLEAIHQDDGSYVGSLDLTGQKICIVRSDNEGPEETTVETGASPNQVKPEFFKADADAYHWTPLLEDFLGRTAGVDPHPWLFSDDALELPFYSETVSGLVSVPPGNVKVRRPIREAGRYVLFDINRDDEMDRAMTSEAIWELAYLDGTLDIYECSDRASPVLLLSLAPQGRTLELSLTNLPAFVVPRSTLGHYQWFYCLLAEPPYGGPPFKYPTSEAVNLDDPPSDPNCPPTGTSRPRRSEP